MQLIVISAPELEQKLGQIVERKVQDVLAAFSYSARENEDELLTIDQAAQFLSLAVPSVYGLVNKSLIPYSKPSGKRLYFSKKELTEWVKNGRRKTVDEISAEADAYLQSRGKGGVRA